MGCEGLDNCHRTMPPARAPDTDGQVAAPFGDVGRQDEIEEGCHPTHELGREIPAQDEVRHRGIETRERTQCLCLLYTSPSPRD